MKKYVVLLSSGLDSTVNLFAAKQKGEVALALTFNYGQRAAAREIEQAGALARVAAVPHKVIALPWFSEFTRTSLVDANAAVPVKDAVSIDDRAASERTAKAVWVPNRNGIFLNIAAAFAEGLGADAIVPGFNAEEAVTFPDNTGAFLEAATKSFSYSTANHVEATCFTTDLVKTEIVQLGAKLGVPFEQIWPCYFGGEAPCGECESCQRFGRALRSAGVTLPSREGAR